jgi:benzoate-CoA ligase family protein
LTALNIAEFFLAERIREGRGERIALRTDIGDVTYVDVEKLAARYAISLRNAGVGRGDRVFVALPDGIEFVGAFFGILKLGAVVVMVNPDLPDERATALYRHCRPRAVVASDAGDTPFVTAADGFDAVVVTPSGVAEGDESSPAEPTDAGDPAVWLFSGGTTGVPKAVVQTHGSFVNTTRRYAHETLGYGPNDVTLSVPKLYFGYATGSNLLFPFSVGGSAVLFPEHPTAELLFDLIDRHQPTIFITVPTMVAKMVGDEGAHDLSSLRFATSAGEALPQELYRSWKDTFGVELLDGLGTAEMWHVFITNRPGAVKPGTVGQPVEGFELKVCDPDGNPVPPGEVGQMWVKGDSLAKGYWDDPDQTEAAFQGSWFVGGDLIRIGDDGYVEHHGRADDRLKVGGKWLAPQEVESCLLEHEAVDTAVVVGVPDQAGLIKPVAFVIPTEERAGLEEELTTWTLARLEPYKHPRRVFVVESLPTTHLGKVDRTKLKEMAAGD